MTELKNDLLIRALLRKPVPRTPVWIMRQAGRYLPEYRSLRARSTDFLTFCYTPELAVEATLQPIRRFGMDGAIIFADILLPLVPMGVELEFVPDLGPAIGNPVRSAHDVAALRPVEPRESLGPTLAALRMVRDELPAETALIGFAGAPFTLASYLIEGGPTRTFIKTKSFMYREPETFAALMDKLTALTISYLTAQAEAGAQVLQLFDSWVGHQGPEDYRRYVLPYVQQIIDHIAPGVPVIHFAAGNPALLPLAAEAGGDVMGIDWRVNLDDAWRAVGEDRAVQGNLDPLVLLSGPEEIRRRAKQVLDQAANRPGHIFNLGHGVVQQTPVDNAIALIEAVRELSS